MAKKSYKNKGIIITGVDDILQKLDNVKDKIEPTLLNAIKKGAQPIKSDMQKYISLHHYSGATEQSFVEEFTIKDGKVFARVGYSVRKGGIAAIFLNIGTPKIAPSFFIDNAIESNEGYLNSVIVEELTKLLED